MDNMSIKKVVFCQVAWMKEYRGVKEDDKPLNGGKYVRDNGAGGEIYNFSPYNHKCYGYVMHYGEELHIERYDKTLKNHSEAADVTVVWVATKGEKCKIVGWYEHATMYRFWQSFYDFLIGDTYEYNFIAEEKDCYLIDEDKREFVIPRAKIAGKGRGMGQSQVWYADSQYAQEEFIPEVLSYLDSVRDTCTPIYILPEEVEKRAHDKGDTTEALLSECKKIAEEKGILDAMVVANLAVDRDDCYDTRSMRAELFVHLLFYNEAEEEFKRAIYHREDVYAIEWLMKIEMLLNHTFLAINLGEKLRKRKEEVADWNAVAGALAFLYIDEGHFADTEALIRECQTESNPDIHEEWIDITREIMSDHKERVK